MLTDFLEDNFGQQSSDVIITASTIALIVIVTWLVRWIVSILMPWIVRRLTNRTKTELDNRIIDIIGPPLRFLIGVLGLWLVLIVLELPYDINSVINRVMASLIAFAIFWAAYRSIPLVVDMFWRIGQRTMQDTVGEMFNEQLARVTIQLARAVIVIFAATVIMREWGYDVGGLVAGLGIGALAVALAAQDALANLIGYFVILADEPFVIGEYIVVNSDVSGTVEGLGFRSTRIRAVDQSLVTVPNKTMMNANLTNWSRLTKRRLDMTLSIDCNSSPDQVLSVVQAIREMLQNHGLVQADSVIVQFVNFNNSSLDIMIICFMKTPNWGDFQAAKQDINLKIMDILAERGIGIAFPTQSLVIEHAALTDAERAEFEKILPPPALEPTAATATDSPVPDDAAN